MKSFVSLFSMIIIVFSGAANAGKWYYEKAIDDFTDNEKHVSGVRANAGNGYIAIKCVDNNVDIILNNGEFIGGNTAKWRYRIDKGIVFTGRGTVSTSSKSVFLSNRDKHPFLQQVTQGNNLLIEIKDFSDVLGQAKFSLQGSTMAIMPVLNACHFELDPVPSFE